MKDFINALKTNENGARTKTLIAVGITAATVVAGVYLTKKNAATPLVLVVEEAAETLVDSATE